MNVGIKERDLETIKTYGHPILVKDLSFIRLSSKRFLLAISKEDASNLVESLFISFCEIGLEADSEPNQIGIQIEEAIDALYSVVNSEE